MQVETADRADDPTWNNDEDLEEKVKEHYFKKYTLLSTASLAWSSLGIIYGDISTSPLYVFQAVFDNGNGEAPTQQDVLGAMSLVFWTMSLIVLLKYVVITLRANDHGEGGTFALYSLLCRNMKITPHRCYRAMDLQQLVNHKSFSRRRKRVLEPMASKILRNLFYKNVMAQLVLMGIVLFATAMVVGDGILTPAISVTSAVSGISAGGSYITKGSVVGISVAIIFCLFTAQHFGTGKVSIVFAPIVFVWLLTTTGIGIYNLSTYGWGAARALNPYYIGVYFRNNGVTAWQDLGAVMLCVTGAEAMFADLGHFTGRAITVCFVFLVYPCLVLTYLGQAAYMMYNLDDYTTVFWSSIPPDDLSVLYWYTVVLAILASIVASQALITGTFSIIKQAMALGLVPRLHVIHTGRKVIGQIYIPVINFILLVLTIAVVVGFQQTTELADAYGVAVMTVMLITTCLLTIYMIVGWQLSLYVVIPFVIIYLPLDLLLLSATLIKVPHGGWFALVIAALVAGCMWVWFLGSRLRSLSLEESMISPNEFFVNWKIQPANSVRTLTPIPQANFSFTTVSASYGDVSARARTQRLMDRTQSQSLLSDQSSKGLKGDKGSSRLSTEPDSGALRVRTVDVGGSLRGPAKGRSPLGKVNSAFATVLKPRRPSASNSGTPRIRGSEDGLLTAKSAPLAVLGAGFVGNSADQGASGGTDALILDDDVGVGDLEAVGSPISDSVRLPWSADGAPTRESFPGVMERASAPSVTITKTAASMSSAVQSPTFAPASSMTDTLGDTSSLEVRLPVTPVTPVASSPTAASALLLPKAGLSGGFNRDREISVRAADGSTPKIASAAAEVADSAAPAMEEEAGQEGTSFATPFSGFDPLESSDSSLTSPVFTPNLDAAASAPSHITYEAMPPPTIPPHARPMSNLASPSPPPPPVPAGACVDPPLASSDPALDPRTSTRVVRPPTPIAPAPSMPQPTVGKSTLLHTRFDLTGATSEPIQSHAKSSRPLSTLSNASSGITAEDSALGIPTATWNRASPTGLGNTLVNLGIVSSTELIRRASSVLGPGYVPRGLADLALSTAPDVRLALMPGMGVYYGESYTGVPPVMMHFMRNVAAVHEVTVFLNVRMQSVPVLSPDLRFLVKQTPELPNFYQVVVRYGYLDSVNHGPEFVSAMCAAITRCLQTHTEPSAEDLERMRFSRDDGEDESTTESKVVSPILSAVNAGYAGPSHPLTRPGIFPPSYDPKKAIATVERAVSEGVVYYVGRTLVRSKREASFLHDLVYGSIYRALVANSWADVEAWGIPVAQIVELGMVVNL